VIGDRLLCRMVSCVSRPQVVISDRGRDDPGWSVVCVNDRIGLLRQSRNDRR